MDCKGLSGMGRLCSKSFGLLLASLAVAHALHDVQNTSMYVLYHGCPPEVSSDVLCSFELTEMANYCMCMINDDFDYPPPLLKGITGYTQNLPL